VNEVLIFLVWVGLGGVGGVMGGGLSHDVVLESHFFCFEILKHTTKIGMRFLSFLNLNSHGL